MQFNPLADLLRQLDDDPLRAADVAEPVAVLVALQLADELSAACSRTGDDGVDVLDRECEIAETRCVRRAPPSAQSRAMISLGMSKMPCKSARRSVRMLRRLAAQRPRLSAPGRREDRRVLPRRPSRRSGARGWWMRLLLLVLVALVASPGTADAGGRGDPFQLRLGRAVRRHALTREEAARFRRAVRRAERVTRLLPSARARILDAVLEQAREPALALNHVRARVLTETLSVNTEQVSRGSEVRDVRAASGVVYRSYGPAGYQFQPLASFASVNAALEAGERARARALAEALLARAEHRGRALVWKYYFGLYGARSHWSSGLTQAVAAQALARVGLVADARAAFAAIRPRLLIALRQGPWVRLYSFSDSVVLNAQLQAVLSLRQYGLIARDRQALRLADELARTSQQLLPAFDSGWWSRYELGGGNAPLDYHRYVTSLLWKLAHAFAGGPWARQARRFSADWREPPHLSIRESTGPVYLRASGPRAIERLEIFLSKPATLTVRLGSSSVTGWRAAGSHVVLWRPSEHTQATVAATISATDYAGNHAEAAPPPIKVLHDTTPPLVRAQLIGDLLFWRASDELSPQLRGLVLFPNGRRAMALPKLDRSGALALTPDAQPPAWLVVADNSGNTTRIELTDSSMPPPPHRLPTMAPLPTRTKETLIWIR